MVTTLRPPPMMPNIKGRIPDALPDDAMRAAARRKPVPPAPAAGPEPDTLFDKTLNMAEAPIGIAGTGAILGLPLLRFMGRGTGWIGDKLKLNFVGKAGRSLQKPADYLDTTLLSDLGKSGWGKKAADAGNAVFSRAGTAAQWMSDKTGFGSRMVARKMGGMHRHLENARNVAGIDVSAVHETLRPHVKSIQETLAAAMHPGHVDMTRLGQAFSEFDTAREILHAKNATIATGATAKNLRKLGTHVGKAVTKFTDAGEIKNIGDTIKNLPKEMGGQSLSHNINYGTWVAGSGLSFVHTARTLMKRWQALKRMHAAIEGVAPEKVSTLGMFFGSVSAPVAAARKHLIKTFFAREAIETLGLAIALKGMRNKHMSGMAVGAQFVGSMAVDSVMGESLVAVYEPLEAAYAAGEKLPPEAYAALIGMASRELESRGGADSAFAKEIGRQYAAENKSPAEVMKEVAGGKLSWRMHELMRANEAARSAHPEKTVSHVDKLKGAPQAHRAVIGENTAKVSREASAPAPGHNI